MSAHPAAQAGLLPFAVALVAALGLARARLAAWAQVAGVLACATLTVGWSFEALTSTRKLVLVVASTALLAAWIEYSKSHARLAMAVSVALVSGGSVWMLWRLIAQQEASSVVVMSALVFAYVAAVVAGTLWASSEAVQGCVTGIALGAGTGAVAVLGASAVLGMLGIAAAASAIATLLVVLVLRGRVNATRTIALPAAVASALAGPVAVVAGELRALCLVPLLIVPFAVRLGTSRVHASTAVRVVVASLAALVPVACAIGLAWFRLS